MPLPPQPLAKASLLPLCSLEVQIAQVIHLLSLCNNHPSGCLQPIQLGRVVGVFEGTQQILPHLGYDPGEK